MKLRLHLLLALQIYIVQALEVLSTEDIIRKPISLVYIYSNECKFCKELNPIIDYLSDVFNHNSEFQIVKVNGKFHEDISQLFLVQSFPTIKLYDNLRKLVITYSGDRLVELIEDFIIESSNARPDISKVKTSILSIKTLHDVDIYSSDKPLLIAFVDLLRNDWRHCFRPFHFYNALSKSYKDINFSVCGINDADSEVLQKFRVSHSPSLAYLHRESIGVFQTLGGDSYLDELVVATFVNLSESREVGNWFDSPQDLYNYADQVKPNVKVLKAGMNQVASINDMFEEDIESQFENLMAKISF